MISSAIPSLNTTNTASVAWIRLNVKTFVGSPHLLVHVGR